MKVHVIVVVAAEPSNYRDDETHILILYSGHARTHARTNERRGWPRAAGEGEGLAPAAAAARTPAWPDKSPSHRCPQTHRPKPNYGTGYNLPKTVCTTV